MYLWGRIIQTPGLGSVVVMERHHPQRVWENLSEREDGTKSWLCAGVRGVVELEGDCWGGHIPSPGRTRVTKGVA